MSKSERVTAAYRRVIAAAVGECLDHGDDAAAWQGRLVAALRRLAGGEFAGAGIIPVVGGKASIETWSRQHTGGGWPSDAVRDWWHEWGEDPARIAEHPAVQEFNARTEAVLTCTRPDLIDDRAWDRSEFVNEQLRAHAFDEGLLSRLPVPVLGGSYNVVVMRPVGDRPIPRAGASAVARLLGELGPHLGRGLLLTTQPNVHGLSPRLRQVLDCLLDGDSEKQVGLRLGLRTTTVHQYVKVLYPHFGVSSRAELLAYFLRRYRRTPAPE